jgi:hypothetical protein
MSLKSFHLVFLIASEVLSLFLAWFFADQYFQTKDKIQIFWSGFFAVSSVVLVFYGRYFLKKLKHISYL